MVRQIRAELVDLSEPKTNMNGAILFNKRLGSCKGALPAVTERSLAALGANAVNDLDSLLFFVRRSVEDKFVECISVE